MEKPNGHSAHLFFIIKPKFAKINLKDVTIDELK